MTIGGWILFFVVTIFIVVMEVVICCGLQGDEHEVRNLIITILIGLVCVIALYLGMKLYFNNTASGQRALRDNYSNLHNGIERTIKQVDDEGHILYQYSGKCDIETDHEAGYILWDDENGTRHILYKSLTSSILIEDL